MLQSFEWGSTRKCRRRANDCRVFYIKALECAFGLALKAPMTKGKFRDVF